MHIFYSALGSTSSGSMLVGKTRITSSYEVAAPVLEDMPELPELDCRLLRDKSDIVGYQSRESLLTKIELLTESLHRAQVLIRTHEVIQERITAQLVIQHAHLTKLNQALHAKENKKTNDRTILFAEGFGRHLTSEESISLVEGQKERKEKEAAEKMQRLEGREARKAAKATAEAEWVQIVTAHEQAVKDWVAECEKLRAQKVRVKDLPPKPKRPPKPKPVTEVIPDEGSEAEDEDEEEAE